jgi:hypothetical protein
MIENTRSRPFLIGGKRLFVHSVPAKAESRVCGLPRHTSDANFAALFTAKSPQRALRRVAARE